ncbi:MAG: response regulator [Sulfuricurvum sp.]|uniref:HD domain-containing phosphohydrolase n=1 Tax=Sulfuricurvum sp. TaxID=2025608 RepID=UPI002735B5A4|nr:HD domain-containing phosphohydrolase [Sulfuricurvum sp.]MDP3291505.1 response regulator [Sulfuricurvum sp.]
MSSLNTSDQLKLLREMGLDITVLYVEDDLKLREEMKQYLGKIFPHLVVCSDGLEGLEVYKNGNYDIVITDIMMPKMTGIEMLGEIKNINPLQEMMITSAYTESEYLLEAIKLGIDAYILKPIQHAQIIEVLYKTVSKIMQARENEEYRQNLELLVDMKVKACTLLEEEKIAYYEKTLLGLIKMVESRDSYTAGHSQRVAEYSKLIAVEMKYSAEQCDLIYRAGLLHDIGKIATPDSILLKPSHLDTLERELIKEHVNVGVDMLSEIPMFDTIVPIIKSHHERYDGEGYPQKLQGSEIHELGKIMIVADAFDAMTTSRIYKGRKNVEEALAEIESLSGSQFDPEIVPYARKAFQHLKVQEHITQLPINTLEEERFAYFYKDPVTGFYNQRYLDLILLKNSYSRLYRCINVISLHHFREYNDAHGWDKGNKLLADVAELIREGFPGLTFFRLHANDFVILGKEYFEFQEGSYEKSELLTQNGLTCSHFHFDLTTENVISLSDLEQRMRDERHRRNQ